MTAKRSTQKITLLTSGFLIGLFLFASTYAVKAQCHPSVDTFSVVVSSTQTINGGFDPIWVCPYDTLISDGGFHNIYLEKGSYMSTGGGIDTIYVKEGASFYMNGGIHVIFYVADTDLLSLGGIPTIVLCDDLTFDYTHAPEGGCIPTGTIAEVANANETLVYPNPVTTQINFDLKNYRADEYTVSIYDAFGKRIIERVIGQDMNSLSAKNFSSGIYFYSLLDKDEVVTRGKFVVE